MSRSTVLIPVPEAEPFVAAHRLRFDPAASKGVPAHITLLFPFVSAASIDESTEKTLASVVASAQPFAFDLIEARRFDQGVLWLAPDPPEPFRALTVLIAELFPECPPWEGSFDEVIPHLTVAHGDRSTLDRVEASVRDSLPIAASAREVWLMIEDAAGQWSTRNIYRLGEPV